MKSVPSRGGRPSAGRDARGRLLSLLVLLGLLMSRPAEAADLLCALASYCVYEAERFSITVVDQETGAPLPGVHALAEWLDRSHRTPLMAEDVVSGPDGVLAFPACGPLRGGPEGLILGEDPVISFFKPGYVLVPPRGQWRPEALTNVPPQGTEERTRVYRFGEDGRTVAMAPFRGSAEDWVKVLDNATFSAGGIPTEVLLRLRVPYLNRWNLLLAEKDHLPAEYQRPGQTFWHLQRMITSLKEGRP